MDSQQTYRTAWTDRLALHWLLALAAAACLGVPAQAQKGEESKYGIEKVAPAQQRVNEIVTLTGAGFGGYVPGVCRVMMGTDQNPIEATAVYVWKDDLIQVRVPSGWSGPSGPVSQTESATSVWVVNGQGESTNLASFQVIMEPDQSKQEGGTGLAFQQLTQIVNDNDVSTVLGSPNMNLARSKDAEVGDVNGDGLMDLIDANSNNVGNDTHGVVRLNNGNGGFTAIALEPNGPGDPGGFYTTVPPGGDFIGNSVLYDADLANVAGSNLPDFIQAAASANRLRILVNTGGGFIENSAALLPPDPVGSVGCPDDLDHADLDNDGDIDLAVAMRTANPQCPGNTSPNRIFINNGNGFGAPIILSAPNGASTHDIFFIDANQDGFQDVMLVNENSSSQLFLNNGNPASPSFTASGSFATAYSGAVADFNGDGLRDFALAGNQAIVYLNSPGNPGAFSSTSLPGGAPGLAYDIELGDLDLNGAVDVVVAYITTNAENTVRVWLNNGNASFTNVTSPGASALLPGVGPYQRLSADLIDHDQDGDLDLYITGADGQNVGAGFGAVPNQLFGNLVRDGIDLPPVADVSADCTGFQCDFDGSGSFDDNGIDRYDWDFGDGSTLPDGPDQVSHTYSAAGEYTAILTVTDTIGQTDSDDVTVNPDCGDSIPPNVSISSPQPGDRVWGNFTIQATASDNVGVTQVRFFVAGTLECIDNSAPYSCIVNGDEYPTANYNLTARAFDACGNSRLSSAVNVRIVSNPEAIIDFPVEDAQVSAEVAIQGWATDPDGVVSVEILFDGQSTILANYGTPRPDVCAALPVNDPNCPNVGFEASFDSTAYANGPHFIDVTATDASDRSTTLRRNFEIDNLPPPPCVADSTTLCLRNGRFEATVTFVNGAQDGDGQAVPWSDKSGIFWFFNPENLEVGVKVLGPGPSGYWWVYHGGGTDREYTLTVKDTLTGNIRTYVKPFGSFCGDPDTQAFPPDPPGGASAASPILAMTFPDGMLPAKAQASGGCIAGSDTLCLRNDRFEVEVLRSGIPQPAVTVTDQSGTFWFFDDENMELIVKVLGPANGYWWVFYGSLTDRDFTLRVTDTQTGQVQEYVNPFGTYCGIGDTQAFPQ